MFTSKRRVPLITEALLYTAVAALATVGAIGTYKALKKKLPAIKGEMCKIKDACIHNAESIYSNICDDMCPCDKSMTPTSDDEGLAGDANTEESPINPT